MSADEDGESPQPVTAPATTPAPVATKTPGREPAARPLPRRFYAEVATAPSTTGVGHVIQLDGRPVRTPGRRELSLPTTALATAVAAEWAAQVTLIDPARMPLTRLANTAIDGVADRSVEVAADIASYATSDLLCYRADYPEGLAERQRALWDPCLVWASQTLGVRLEVVNGLMPVAQPADTSPKIAASIVTWDPFKLTAVHVMTTLMGSALLALAVVHGRLTAEAAWEAAHLDEDWQIADWGEDAEAKARRARRWTEMQAAAGLAKLAAH